MFDRGYAQVTESLDGDSVINTTSPVLGVRDAEFIDSGRQLPAVSDRVFVRAVGGKPINQLFVVTNVEPDSHGGSKLVLNVVKQR
uniref:head-tail joining protein n=1 Tax=Edwardsiella tarda TaxID=636 RepID=UPI00402AA3BC